MPITDEDRKPREGELGEAEIRGAVARLLASDDLRASPQLASFLRFIVDETLAGRADAIKGYTIATEALGRDAAFDPQSDPILRVEATRLRRAIDRYYAAGGQGDPVEVVVPKGGYVPKFRARPTATPSHLPPASLPDEDVAVAEVASRAQPAWSRWRVSAMAVAVPTSAVLLCLGLIFVVLTDLPRRVAGAGLQDLASTGSIPAVAPPPVEGAVDLPVIRVEPLVELGSLVDGPASARGLMLRMRDALARFDEVVVL